MSENTKSTEEKKPSKAVYSSSIGVKWTGVDGDSPTTDGSQNAPKEASARRTPT